MGGFFSYAVKAALLFTVYLLTARLGLRMDAVSGFATLVWAPSGIALASLLLLGYRFFPFILAGAFVVNHAAGAGVFTALGISAGNTAEALLGAYLLRDVVKIRYDLSRLRDVIAMVLLAAMLSTAVSATVGVASLQFSGVVSAEDRFHTWLAWWKGDMMGDLIIAPLILVWSRGAKIRWNPLRWAEAVALAAVVAALNLMIFTLWLGADARRFTRSYFLFPIVLWSAIRFGQRGTVSVMLFIAAASVWFTSAGSGPFVTVQLSESLFQLQNFLVILQLTGLALAAAITQRRRAEAQLARAVQARDDFISMASHELRTPLTAMQFQIQVIEREGKFPGLVQGLQKEMRRFSLLINNLLDVSRITDGRFLNEPEKVDLAGIVKGIVEGHVVEIRQSGSSVKVSAETPVVGYWDRFRLEQIVTNLFTNALKYGGGKPIEISLEADADSARLFIRDQGIGISPQDQGRIFQRFERIVSGRHYSGFGLGLWIVRRILESMQGSIEIVSETGKGSTFKVTLPRGKHAA